MATSNPESLHYQACVREVREELGIEPEISRLLVLDWAPNDAEGDKILFVFNGGRLTDAQVGAVRLFTFELSEFGFFAKPEFGAPLTDRLVRRITFADDLEARVIRSTWSMAVRYLVLLGLVL